MILPAKTSRVGAPIALGTVLFNTAHECYAVHITSWMGELFPMLKTAPRSPLLPLSSVYFTASFTLRRDLGCQGVSRAHVVPPTSGALLQELYTRDGAGLLISRDM